MSESSELLALRPLGLAPNILEQLPRQFDHQARLCRVVAVQRDVATVHDGHQAQIARLWPALHLRLEVQAASLVVGDWVLVRSEPEPAPAWILDRLPPCTVLHRRDASGRRQALAANVDTALLVMTCGQDFNLARLDRYLTLVQLAGVEPVVVLSKADLAVDLPGRIEAVRHHLGDRVPVVALVCGSSEASSALAPWLTVGRTLVLLGSSGAGKSTLTRTLCGEEGADIATGAVRDGDERGRHTTTSRSLYRCIGGACIIDTPGLRGLQLDASAAELAGVFDDVHQLALHCRFRDCQHQAEPGCAVRAGLSEQRLRSYHRLLREAQRDPTDWLARKEQLAVWKSRSRSARTVARRRRGEIE